MPAEVSALVRHYRRIERERMQGLPFLNSKLDVEAVGFERLGAHRLGVLITPWFMNMVLLPGSDDWAGLEPGAAVTLPLPSADYDFTVCDVDGFDEPYLSAVLFRTMTDFPDQTTARAIAEETLRRLLEAEEPAPGARRAARYNRRQLLAGEGGA